MSNKPHSSPLQSQERPSQEPQSSNSGGVSALQSAIQAAKPKTNREKKEPVALLREEGKSLFPVSRVQKILKADKELPIIAKEAVFIISRATEGFIQRFSDACHKQAEREKRTTTQWRDVASVIRKADEFVFLEDIITLEEKVVKVPDSKAQNKAEADQSAQKSEDTDSIAKYFNR